jgi:hypothetical protein
MIQRAFGRITRDWDNRLAGQSRLAPIRSKRRRHFPDRTKTFKLSRDPKFLEKITDGGGTVSEYEPRRLGDNRIQLMQTDR